MLALKITISVCCTFDCHHTYWSFGRWAVYLFCILNYRKSMKEWNKVLLGSIGVLALLFVADRVVGALWEKTYKHSRYGIFHRQEYCLHKSDDNILILGSSRAAHHYVPKIFTDSLRELLQWWKRWTVHLLRIWYSVSIHRKKINFSNCYL